MIEELKPYESYKSPGLRWADRIPSHWQVDRARSCLQKLNIRSREGREELLTVSSARGVVPRKSATVTMFKAKSYAGYKLCWRDDLVINSLWAWAGGLGVSRHHGIVSSAYGVYRPRPSSKLLPGYLHELVRSAPFNWELQVRSKGIWISRLQLSDDAFLAAPVLVPPAEEQAAIVRFLDPANRRIDQFIRAKKKLIALLNEQKQAIIHRAVTRGIDPSVKLKDSGVPWLGQIPAHWEALQTRRLLSLVTSGSRGWAAYYNDNGAVFLQSGNLGRSMALNLRRIQRVKLPIGAEGVRTRIRRDDVLICITGALTGNVVVVGDELSEPAYVNQHVALCRSREGHVVPRFLAFCLHSNIGATQFKASEYGGTKQGLGLDDVRNVWLPVPPTVAEQRRIVDYIDAELGALAPSLLRAEKEIALAREYRTRLVADVVTGQLDARAAAASLPDVESEAAPSQSSDEDETDIDGSEAA